MILIATGDGLASSRLLHPGLHKLLSGPLGSPFRAGIPDRDTLVVYTDRHRSRLQTKRTAGQGPSQVELSHHPPPLSRHARRHRAGPEVNPGHAGGSRPRGGVTPVRVGGRGPWNARTNRWIAVLSPAKTGLQILSRWSVGVVVRSYPGPNDFSMADRSVQESIPQTQAIHWGERFDESTLSDPSWDLVEKSDTEGFAPTPYE